MVARSPPHSADLEQSLTFQGVPDPLPILTLQPPKIPHPPLGGLEEVGPARRVNAENGTSWLATENLPSRRLTYQRAPATMRQPTGQPRPPGRRYCGEGPTSASPLPAGANISDCRQMGRVVHMFKPTSKSLFFFVFFYGRLALSLVCSLRATEDPSSCHYISILRMATMLVPGFYHAGKGDTADLPLRKAVLILAPDILHLRHIEQGLLMR